MTSVCAKCLHFQSYYDIHGGRIVFEKPYHSCKIYIYIHPITGEPVLPKCEDKNGHGDCKDFEPIPPKIPWHSKFILWYRNTFPKKKRTPEEDRLLTSSFDIVSTHKEPWYLPILKWLMR